jgi:hypothetical protein
MLGVLLTQGIAEQLQTLFVAAFNVVDKTPFEADAHGPVHTDKQHDTGGENGQKELSGNTGSPDFHD